MEADVFLAVQFKAYLGFKMNYLNWEGSKWKEIVYVVNSFIVRDGRANVNCVSLEWKYAQDWSVSWQSLPQLSSLDP